MAQDKDIIDLTGSPQSSDARTEVEENPLAVARLLPPDLLLVIFIHGCARVMLSL